MITVEIWNQILHLETDPRLFSPRQADVGTLAMLRTVQLQPSDRLLDLGCGYGLVGIAAAKVLGAEQVVMVDVDPLAAETARRNAELNGCPQVKIVAGDGPQAVAPDHFSLILSNPPYHTDFSVAKRLIEQSFLMLDVGGRLIMVVKRLDWYKNKLKTVFGGVRVLEADGYYILSSEKRPKLEKTAEPDQDKTGQLPRKHLKRLEQSANKKSLNKTRKNSKKNQP